MDITNRTTKPVSVPLPGGKKLFLAPGKTGQVTQKALEYAPLVKLIEDGSIESTGGEKRHPDGELAKGGLPKGNRQKGTGAMRQAGDR
jgi:hypothetical protein